jgi:hypothetical protein
MTESILLCNSYYTLLRDTALNEKESIKGVAAFIIKIAKATPSGKPELGNLRINIVRIPHPKPKMIFPRIEEGALLLSEAMKIAPRRSPPEKISIRGETLPHNKEKRATVKMYDRGIAGETVFVMKRIMPPTIRARDDVSPSEPLMFPKKRSLTTSKFDQSKLAE